MNKLRGYAAVLGLAGMLLMVAADTKDVEATGKISYESESGTESERGVKPAAGRIADCSNLEIVIQEWKKETARQQEQVILAARSLERAEEIREEAQRAREIPPYVVELSEADYEALLRIVEAEAYGEDILGRMLVANVVINRVKSPVFPDSVEEVVYQCKNGKAQFSPVATGKISRVRVSQETVEAVERALRGEDESRGALYFVSRTYAAPESIAWFDQSLTWLFSYHGHEFYA